VGGLCFSGLFDCGGGSSKSTRGKFDGAKVTALLTCWRDD